METLFNYPEYAEINGKKYKINTDYRIAIRCNDISTQDDINEVEKGMAIIYLLFGDEALKDISNYDKLIEKAFYFLKCGDINEKSTTSEHDMDLVQDFPYIEASFMSDYKISLENENMHWWKFYYLLCGLSQSEMGNSCVLNRIRDLRTYDLNKIKDPKEREKLKEAKERFALKKNKKVRAFSEEELKNMEAYHKLIGD